MHRRHISRSRSSVEELNSCPTVHRTSCSASLTLCRKAVLSPSVNLACAGLRSVVAWPSGPPPSSDPLSEDNERCSACGIRLVHQCLQDMGERERERSEGVSEGYG